MSIFAIQNLGPKLGTYEVVNGLQPRHVNTFFTKSALDLPVISLVTKSNHFDNDNLGLCFLIGRKLETEITRSRDLWSRLQTRFDRNSENKLGSLVNCVSRNFAVKVISDIKRYDYSSQTLETVFKFMKNEIPPALAFPIISNFLWMKRYSYDFYLKNVARKDVVKHLSPSMFLYELKVISYKDLEENLITSVMKSEEVCPIVIDMLFKKLHKDSSNEVMRPDISQIVPYLSVLGTRTLNSKDSSYWAKIGEVLINKKNHKLETMQEFDLSRLIFENIGGLLSKQKYLEPNQLIPISRGIPFHFYQSGLINDVELENFLRENSQNLGKLSPSTEHVLLNRGPINRENLKSFATRQHCYKFSVLRKVWFSEYQEFIVGVHSQLFFDKIEKSLIQSCEVTDPNLGALDYAVRLRGFMKNNPTFKINARSVNLLESALSGILIEEILNLSPFEALDVINLITSNSEVYKSDDQLIRTLANKAFDVASTFSKAQFGVKGDLTWKNIPQIYLSYFNSFMLRELPLDFYKDEVENEIQRQRCVDIISKIGYSEKLKTHFSPFKAQNFTNFYLNCVNKTRLSSEDLVTMGSLICELPSQFISQLKPDSVRSYGYLFNGCCLTKSQSSALLKLAQKADLSFEEAYLSFGAALPIIYSDAEEFEKIKVFIEKNQQKRIYFEKVASSLSQGVEILYENGSFCRRKLSTRDFNFYENSMKLIFNSTYTKLKSLIEYKPYISSSHDKKFTLSPSCAMMKTFGESLRFADLNQLQIIADFDFQNCVKPISDLKFLQPFQIDYFRERLISLKKAGHYLKEMGSLVSKPKTNDDFQLLLMINFTDYDEVSLHSYLETLSFEQLKTGFDRFCAVNQISSLKDLKSLEIATLGNFICAADVEELFSEEGLELKAIKFSLPTFSKLSACGHEKMRIIKNQLEKQGLISNKLEEMTEFDVNDYGYILSGFTALELNEISVKRSLVLQYADVPFFNALPDDELQGLKCTFWNSIQPKMLQKIPDKRLGKLGEAVQQCILKNIHSGIIPRKHLLQIQGQYFEFEGDDSIVDADKSSISESDENSQKKSGKNLNILTENDDYLRSNRLTVTYIVLNSSKLLKFTVEHLLICLFLFNLHKFSFCLFD